MIEDLPPTLTQDARTDLGAKYSVHIDPDEELVLKISGGVPIKEVKMLNNIGVLDPGEAAISGGFALCSAVIAKKGDKLFLMHIYPKKHGTVSVMLIDEYITHVRDRFLSQDEKFDKVILIGRQASRLISDFEKITAEKPQVIQLDIDKDGYFNIVVYNSPSNPGDISNFDLWFDEKKTVQ